MESLQSTSEKVTVENKRAKKLRRYIVVEAVYRVSFGNYALILLYFFNLQNSGQIAPLDEIIRLKEKYRFRVLLDKRNSFGVLGSSGRGITEQHGVPIEKVDIITASMGHSLATERGFCRIGSVRVTAHQHLSNSGYVFSASLPPYLPTAAITAIDVLEENPDLITKLNKNIVLIGDMVDVSAILNLRSLIKCLCYYLEVTRENLVAPLASDESVSLIY
ncbi:hypothetical protein CsSME_00011148 [Camellia sinensis var. sinensis]